MRFGNVIAKAPLKFCEEFFYWLMFHCVFLLLCLKNFTWGKKYPIVFKIWIHLMCICVHGFTCNICNPNDQPNPIRLETIFNTPRRISSDNNYD